MLPHGGPIGQSVGGRWEGDTLPRWALLLRRQGNHIMLAGEVNTQDGFNSTKETETR